MLRILACQNDRQRMQYTHTLHLVCARCALALTAIFPDELLPRRGSLPQPWPGGPAYTLTLPLTNCLVLCSATCGGNWPDLRFVTYLTFDVRFCACPLHSHRYNIIVPEGTYYTMWTTSQRRWLPLSSPLYSAYTAPDLNIGSSCPPRPLLSHSLPHTRTLPAFPAAGASWGCTLPYLSA